MKRLLCLSELLCVSRPLGVSVFFLFFFFVRGASVIHRLHLNQRANKLAHEHQVLPSCLIAHLPDMHM